MNSAWLITFELANQRARKVLFTCVVYLTIRPVGRKATQGAKKVVSDSPGLVDFSIGLVNSVINLPDGQAKIFRRIKITKVL